MVSRTAEHAIRAVLYLARRAGDAPVAVETIAEALGAPRNYLSKTLHALTKHGVVESVRGVRGGFRLAVTAETLPLSRIVALFDEPRATGMCMLGGRPCDARIPCAAHLRWTAITQAAHAPLRTTTVADMIGGAPAELEPQLLAG